jgi:hypothetical protein
MERSAFSSVTKPTVVLSTNTTRMAVASRQSPKAPDSAAAAASSAITESLQLAQENDGGGLGRLQIEGIAAKGHLTHAHCASSSPASGETPSPARTVVAAWGVGRVWHTRAVLVVWAGVHQIQLRPALRAVDCVVPCLSHISFLMAPSDGGGGQTHRRNRAEALAILNRAHAGQASLTLIAELVADLTHTPVSELRAHLAAHIDL